MPKRGIDVHNLEMLKEMSYEFSMEDIGSIVETVNLDLPDGKIEVQSVDGSSMHVEREKYLLLKLNIFANNWAIDSFTQVAPTEMSLKDAFEGVEGAADKLLKKLFIDDTSRVEDVPISLRSGQFLALANLYNKKNGIDTSATDTLQNIISGIQLLKKWSADLKDRSQNRNQSFPVKRNSPDKALNNLYREIAGLYEEVWHRKPGLSVQEQTKPSGPLLRFYNSILKLILGSKKPTDKAIRARYRRLFGPASN